MSNSSFKVTITEKTTVNTCKKIVFTWDETCNECDYKSFGFEDDEIEMFIDTKTHQGKNLEGYNVTIE